MQKTSFDQHGKPKLRPNDFLSAGAFGGDERNVVVLFLDAESTHFLHNRRQQSLAGKC